MKRSGRTRRLAGAEMVGPDGVVYFVPDRVQTAFRLPVLTGPGLIPVPSDVPASVKVRKGVQESMDYLPQMPVGPC
jgi:hypothetical protein